MLARTRPCSSGTASYSVVLLGPEHLLLLTDIFNLNNSRKHGEGSSAKALALLHKLDT